MDAAGSPIGTAVSSASGTGTQILNPEQSEAGRPDHPSVRNGPAATAAESTLGSRVGHRDQPGSVWARARTPLSLIGAGVATVSYFGLTNPHGEGLLPPCLLLTLTGLDCPLCGGSRAIHDLTRGQLAEAADHNLLVVFLIPLVAVGLVAWLWTSVRGNAERSGRRGFAPASTDLPNAGLGGRVKMIGRLVTAQTVMYTFLLILLVFAVVRNLPSFAFLDSGLS